MQQPRTTRSTNRLVRIDPREVVVAATTRHYRSEIQTLLQELHLLLPRYWNAVDPGQYAYDRDEVMALTAAYQDGSLGLADLEALMDEVKRQRQTFGDALSKPTPAA